MRRKRRRKQWLYLEVITDGKNNQTKKNDCEYVQSKRTRDGTCLLLGVSPSFVSTDNKCILSCAIISRPLNESNDELRMFQWYLYIFSS